MSDYKAANITKVDAGGSGDNVVSDGYIKTVEKVWIDSFNAGTNYIGSGDTIKIGSVAKGKKITDVVVAMPATTALATNTTVYLGTGTGIAVNGGYLGALQPDGVAAGTYTYASNKAQTLRLQGAYIATEAPADLDLYIRIVPAGGKVATVTACTIKSVIKYT